MGMNKQFKYLIRTMLFVGLLLFISFQYGPSDNLTVVQGNQRSTDGEKIVFNKNNHRQINAVSYHHIFNKEK